MTPACLLWCSLRPRCSALLLVIVVCSILCSGFSMQSEYSYGGDSNLGPYSAASAVLEIIAAMQTPGKVSWSAPLVLRKLIFRISTILAIKEYFCQWGLIILLSMMQLGNRDRGTSCNFLIGHLKEKIICYYQLYMQFSIRKLCRNLWGFQHIFLASETSSVYLFYSRDVCTISFCSLKCLRELSFKLKVNRKIMFYPLFFLYGCKKIDLFKFR